jgi:sulfite reductase (ferredoxin)
VRRLARGRSSAPPSPASPPTRSSTAPPRSARSSGARLGNPEYSNLPRKFKTALTGHPSHDVSPETNDVAFVGTVHPEHGPGSTSGSAAGCPPTRCSARSSGLDPVDEVADVWEGVTSIFRDYGYRRLRSRPG